jgi:hypothetical protein
MGVEAGLFFSGTLCEVEQTNTFVVRQNVSDVEGRRRLIRVARTMRINKFHSRGSDQSDITWLPFQPFNRDIWHPGTQITRELSLRGCITKETWSRRIVKGRSSRRDQRWLWRNQQV